MVRAWAGFKLLGRLVIIRKCPILTLISPSKNPLGSWLLLDRGEGDTLLSVDGLSASWGFEWGEVFPYG